jgi:D-xylose transport system ATP-binding protein
MHDVFEVADRISVLRLGQQVGVFNRKDVDQRDIIHSITAGEMQFVPGMEAHE